MQNKHNKAITPNARDLRKNMTPQELHLWHDYLKTYPIRILRQKVISKYITDFDCAQAKLAIELDGSGHYTEEGADNDFERTKILDAYGVKVIRFENSEVSADFSRVCSSIDSAIKQRISDIQTRNEEL